jgi:hypothetical protein
MLKVYSIRENIKKEVNPVEGIYSVVEGFDYVIEYYSDNIDNNSIFIEDIPLRKIDYETTTKRKIKTIQKKFFIDYFGYACVKINNEEFIFNIKVEKFKLNEIEDIFTFLWNKEENLFHNFFSKSTKTIKFDKSGIEINNTSKYILFANYFINTFEALAQTFKLQPHTKLKSIKKEEDFANSKITQYSIDWLFKNLDTLNFNEIPIKLNACIELNRRPAVIHKIGTEEKINSFNTYENTIIIGSIKYLKVEILKIKKGIASLINVEALQIKEFAEFSDLKKIPFLQMYQESISIEKRCNRLIKKYQRIFKNTPSRMERPQLTPAFSSKIHYKKAYKIIKNLFNYRFVLDGEFRLLNITKLSQLYEVYNFHILNDSIKEILDKNSFNNLSNSTRQDGLTNMCLFQNHIYTVKLHYENSISNANKNSLVRIDKRNGSYYKPDYILELSNNETGTMLYWILDSKYSKQTIVKNRYLNDCIFKYILNVGFIDDPYKKIEGLVLLYPSGNNSQILESNFHKPTIDLIVSKPQSESYLFNYISQILNSNLPKDLIKVKYR